MRIIFAGTPEFVLPSLTAILGSAHQLVAVYTMPDRAAGRGLKKRSSAVKDFAIKHTLPLEQVETFDDSACQKLRSYTPDLMVVMGYGLILPSSVLAIPTYGCINAHLSLLPRWRGAAPVVRAIEAGDTLSGVSLILMTQALDCGAIIMQQEQVISRDETAASLYDKLADVSAKMLDAFLKDPRKALATTRTQDEAGACYATKLKKDDAWLDWQQPAVVLERKVRAFNPSPVAQTKLGEMRLRIWSAQQWQGEAQPGQIIETNKMGIVVACKQDALLLLTVQPQGGRCMRAVDFANGHRTHGMHLHSPMVG